jgi:hypothetical protein
MKAKINWQWISWATGHRPLTPRRSHPARAAIRILLSVISSHAGRVIALAAATCCSIRRRSLSDCHRDFSQLNWPSSAVAAR